MWGVNRRVINMKARAERCRTCVGRPDLLSAQAARRQSKIVLKGCQRRARGSKIEAKIAAKSTLGARKASGASRGARSDAPGRPEDAILGSTGHQSWPHPVRVGAQGRAEAAKKRLWIGFLDTFGTKNDRCRRLCTRRCAGAFT